MPRPVIALDGDGVLLDYSTGYAAAWARAFSEHPTERAPNAYWPIDRWNVQRLSGDALLRLQACFDEAFWSSVPVIDGALDACHSLVDNGFDLVCVTALEARFEQARLRNLRAHGFPIERVIATGRSTNAGNPKAGAIRKVKPVAFVDDYLPYLQGLIDAVHPALVVGPPSGSPNVGAGLAQVRSQHSDLAEFASWWLGRT